MKYKICNKCGENKELIFFSKKSASIDGYRSVCKSCHNKYSREIWYPKNKAKHQKATAIYKKKNTLSLKAKKYNISVNELIQLINNNKNCIICNKNPSTVIDHDHISGKVRGLLCAQCNLMLGFAEDDTTILKNAILYLENFMRNREMVNS